MVQGRPTRWMQYCGSLLLLIGLASCSQPARQTEPRADKQPTADPSAAVNAVADDYFAAMASTFPEWATSNDLPGADHGRLYDNSLAAAQRWAATEDALLARLAAIDPDGLRGKPAEVTYGVVHSALAGSRFTRVCRLELWAVNSYVNGWQASLTDLARIQPVGTDALRAAALARARATPAYIDTEIAKLREGLKLGYSSPKVIVENVIAQINQLIATPPEESPFSSPAQRDATPAFRQEYERVVEDAIVPALRRYRDYLASEYLPKARSEIGVSANPDGAACYAATLLSFSTKPVSADVVYATGLEEMRRIEAEMREITQRLFGTGDIALALQRARTERAYTFGSEAEILAYAQAAMQRAAAASPRAFGITTDAAVRIEPYPAFRAQAGAPGQYEAPTRDSSRPGIYYINTYEPTQLSRASVESTTFHETWPGHHQQTMAARQGAALHPIVQNLYNSGFGEGWALYAERVADEQGLYSGDIDRLGYLASQAFRAARMVIDAGIHTRGMGYQEAADYLASHTTRSPAEVTGEINRYISWPGQAPSYMIGALEIRRLRDEAQRTMGEKFDIRAFHDRVLEQGQVTLPLMRAHVERWIESSR